MRETAMKALITAIAFLGLTCACASAAVVYDQPASTAGGRYKSSCYAPDGLDGDEYAWDNFTLASSAAISEIHWRGCYSNYLSGAGKAPVYAFTVSIYRSIAAGSQPDLGTGGRLARYTTNSNAGETLSGIIAGVQIYDYAYTLTTPFQAAGGTKYWIQIEASQGVTPIYGWPPDWSLCAATGGDNIHFRGITGGNYAMISGDLAFSLYTSGAATVSIDATASPANAGTITGAGPYPVNSTASLTAAPNAGWGFVSWTESGTQVSTNAHYTFTAAADRTLVANFTNAYTITTSASPTYGGTTSGGGVYNSGATATVIATPNHGFLFSGWSDGGTTATHMFPATSDVQITAFFVPDPLSVTFDFDNAPVHTSLPVDVSVDGLSAHLSATGAGFSIQPFGSVGLAPAGMSGLYIFPNSVFAADLLVSFSERVSDFSILYSPQELGCDTSATMRVTTYLDGAAAGTSTATAPVPGTYPTGTLSIAVPTGFNSVVVHYDARPATCADWGPIFLADIMTVTRMCTPISVATQPAATIGCIRSDSLLSVVASGPSPSGLTDQWEHEVAAGAGTFAPVVDGPTGTGSTISGATNNVLGILAASGADTGRYRCVIAHPCGVVTSDAAALSMCPADFDCNGQVMIQDIFSFLNAWFAGDPRSDFNATPGLSVQDIFDYLNAWFAGCP
jgi:hypothetical protein